MHLTCICEFVKYLRLVGLFIYGLTQDHTLIDHFQHCFAFIFGLIISNLATPSLISSYVNMKKL